MAFWLATARRGQDGEWIQRFDPRFWTVNFPRPQMASVVTIGADALRVDCEFHHQGALAGLIWESEDRLDHPLLRYETQRDYAHCILTFRWRSGGLVALDAVDGPTLTIEGRDAQGAARSWYVRLWNYAKGTPTDAVITLPFSALQAGWVPGEAVHPSDIDRMFVSLVPPGYVAGSTAPLAARADGWAEMSAIRCEGDRAMLDTGAIMLPPHAEQIATAYDDLYDQTPERVLRQVHALGYRGRICHYVGMSHFYRLAAGGEVVDPAGVLCEPARRWHEDFFARAVRGGYAPIVSQSYELFAAHCPEEWRQLALDGTPALTGWEPPSTLLSPANGAANAFLQGIATRFVALLEAAGGAPLFQIGEPWWWVQPATGAPCLYDAATRAELGSALVDIADMRAPLDEAQRDALDAAGAVLAASTLALAGAVRAAAQGTAEILLLVFTPTLLDPAMPELRRASLPTGWAWPAFDRLQLEDYDWLTGGHDAARRAAYALVAERFGYPLAATDYLSGFVLRGEDAAMLWPRIDAGLDEARARGIASRFVWALPQVARDGYVRLPDLEDEVDPFDDIAYPLALGRDAQVSPEFSTSVAVTASGFERRNALWSDARMRYDVGPGVRSEAELGTLIAFFRARYGPARGFRLRDPFDHSSAGMTDVPAAIDQQLGTGDGATARFRLVKHYGEQSRPITRPVPGSVVVAIDGAETQAFTLETGGWIVLDAAPAPGAIVTAGFLFDVPVRFAEDRIDISGLSFAAGEAPSVPLVEIREAV